MLSKMPAFALPLRLDIKIGFDCNNNCDFCAQGDKRSLCKRRPLKQITRDMEDAKKKGVNGVVFTGGEPTLHPDILQVASAARNMGFKTIQLQTNGRTLAYRDFCEKLIKAGITEVSPALHGSTPEIHENLTHSQGSFREVLMGIRNLKALGIHVLTNTVINSLNFKDLPALARLFVRLNVDQFQFAFVHIIGRAWDNRFRLVPKKSECVPYVKKGLEIGRAAGIPCYTEAIPYCFMNGFEDFISEKIIPDGPVVDDDVLVKSFQVYRRSYGKIKGPPCKKCFCRKVCEGPWKEYTEIYGWEEFNPVTAKQSCR